MTRQAYASRNWWLSLSAWLVLGWLGLHLMGTTMTIALEERLGFFPIWFLDCVACSAPDFSLPYGLPVFGGLSLGAVVGLPAAGLVVARGRRLVDFLTPAAEVILVAAMAIHVVVTWPSRYPGSVPPVAVAVVLPSLAVITGAIGLFGVLGRSGAPTYERVRVSVWASVCLVSGVLSMALFGGVVSILALGLCGWRLRFARPGMNRVLVVSGGILSALSLILRALLHARYPSMFGWLW